MTEKDDHPTCPERPYDVVLFGATGFAGGLTADYLVEHLPESGRMALAGRNRDKLEAVRDRLTGINPDVSDIGLLHADFDIDQHIRLFKPERLGKTDGISPQRILNRTHRCARVVTLAK